LSLLTMGVLMM